MSGYYVAIEGTDAAGKGTVIAGLAERIRGAGVEPVLCREPGGTAIGEALRAYLFENHGMPQGQEAMFFLASRAALSLEVIAPTLAAGGFVLSDRGPLSTLAYQCGLGGLDWVTVSEIISMSLGGRWPDLNVVLTTDHATATARAGGRGGGGKYDDASEAEFEAIRTAFTSAAGRVPGTVEIVDASGSPEHTLDAAWAAVARHASLAEEAARTLD